MSNEIIVIFHHDERGAVVHWSEMGELVRCADCKHYDAEHPYPVCNYHEDNVKETDYCSWGERKSNGHSN